MAVITKAVPGKFCFRYESKYSQNKYILICSRYLLQRLRCPGRNDRAVEAIFSRVGQVLGRLMALPLAAPAPPGKKSVSGSRCRHTVPYYDRRDGKCADFFILVAHVYPV